MTTSYSDNLRISKQGDNDNPSTWGDIVNTQVIELLEDAIAGVVQIDCTGGSNVNIASTTQNGAVDDARNMVLELIGTISANIQLIVPAVEKLYAIRTAYTGAFTIEVIPAGGSTGVTFNTGQSTMLYTSGTDIYNIGIIGGSGGALLAANNLSDIPNKPTARANLGVAIGTNVQAYDATLASVAAYNTAGLFTQVAPDTFTGRTITGVGIVSVADGDGVGGNPAISVDNTFIPQNSHSADYTLVLGDAGETQLHPSADTNARTFTIDSNANVAYAIGTALTFVNQNGAGVLSIAITTDTMRLAGVGTTGTRTLAANGIATALKLTATEWIVSGVGIT